MLVIIFQKLIFDNPVSGYPSIMCSVLFLGGIQLIGIGVLGEYIPEFPIYLYIAGFRRQFSSPSRSKTSLWRPKISPSQTFPVDEL
jgi:hypothetical protein